MDKYTSITPSYAEIDFKSMKKNFLETKKAIAPHTKIMPIVKADAYGHGILKTGQQLEKWGAYAFGVATHEEALKLRLEAEIKIPILCLTVYFIGQLESMLKHDISLTVPDIIHLVEVHQMAKKLDITAKIHLKIDTGMGRMGTSFLKEYREPFFQEANTILESKYIKIEGLFSHFATSESTDLTYANLQLKRFQETITSFEKIMTNLSKHEKPLYHMSNSGGILQLPDAHFDMVRPGALIYGLNPLEDLERSLPLKLTESLQLIAHISFLKKIKKGEGVSYGQTWHASEDTWIATIPIGYGDGYPRHLSNKAKILIQNRPYPIVGQVCMDQLLVNLGAENPNIRGIKKGERAVILGSGITSASQLAKLAETDCRDLLVRMPMRAPQRYLNFY